MKTLFLRLSEDELLAYDRMAVKRGIELKAWIRGALNSGAEGALSSLLEDGGTLTGVELAARLCITPRSLNNYVRLSGLPYVEVDGKKRYVWARVIDWYKRIRDESETGKPSVKEPSVDRRPEALSEEHPSLDTLTMSQAARRLCISDRQLRNYVKIAGIPFTGSGYRKRFKWGELLEWYVLYRMRMSSQDGALPQALPKRVYQLPRRKRSEVSEATAAPAPVPDQAGTSVELQAAAARPRLVMGDRCALVQVGAGDAVYVEWPADVDLEAA